MPQDSCCRLVLFFPADRPVFSLQDRIFSLQDHDFLAARPRREKTWQPTGIKMVFWSQKSTFLPALRGNGDLQGIFPQGQFA